MRAVLVIAAAVPGVVVIRTVISAVATVIVEVDLHRGRVGDHRRAAGRTG